MNKLYDESFIQNTANAIREKNGTTKTMKISDFETKIKQLPPINVVYHTETAYDDEKASEVVSVAQSYLDAIADGRLTIKYKAGYSALSGNNQKLKDTDGTYIIQCSAFAGLVLRGIPYEESPYFDGDGSKVNARTDLYSWANPDYEKAGIADANELALYAYQNGQILNSNNISAIKKGDLLFYQYFDNAYFGSIWHVVIAMEDGGTKCVHALWGQSSAIWAFDINNVPSNYTLGKLLYIARPYKSGTVTVTQPTLKITQHPQDQTGNVGDIATFTVKAEGDGLTYEWQYSTNGTNWYKSGFTGWDTDTQPVEINTYRSGQMYRCVVTDSHGNSVTSGVATLYCSGNEVSYGN